MSSRRAVWIAVIVLLVAWRLQPSSPLGAAPGRTVVVQGAMQSEVQALVAALEQPVEERVQGWLFWKGTLAGQPVVISKTQKGMANAAAATALAVERFRPAAIINQGTAGGHEPSLRVWDIVVGTASVNIGAFKTGRRARGEGSNFAEWKPLDLLKTEGSAGQDPNAWVMRRFEADAGLLAAARRARDTYKKGKVVEGVIASSDVWNSELDRIQRLHDEFGTTVEEMETAAAAQVAAQTQVPFIGIRVVSNNITNDGAHDPRSAEGSQSFVVEVLRAYASVPAQK